MRRITAVVVASAAVLFLGCEGSGSPLDTNLQCTEANGSQNANEYSNCLSFVGGGGGGGGGSGGSAGDAPAALYRLISVNNNALPFNFGGAEDSVVTVDSTRVINFLLDSAYISLNTDSSAVQIYYMSIRDERIATTHPPANFNYVNYHVADTSTGTWSDSTGQPVIELLTGDVSNLGYLYSGDTLSGDFAYNIIDSVGTDVSGPAPATFKFQNVGSPFHSIVVHHRSPFAAASPIRESRIGSPTLSLVGSDYRRGRLVRVVRQ